MDWDNLIISGIIISIVSGLIGIGFYFGYHFNNHIDYQNLYHYENQQKIQCENNYLNISNQFEQFKLNNSNIVEQCNLVIDNVKLELFTKYLEKGYLIRGDLN